jgi:hypothetical protein
MLGRVIVAVDYACGEAESYSDERFVRYCWEELFPILEAEREKAAAEEGLTPILEWQKAAFGE